MIKTTVGYSIKTWLSQMGITSEYVADRIQTVFLDGKAVDDIEATVIRDGSNLSLSGALPGLVGATLRRGGFFASLRSSITHSVDDEMPLQKDGWVTVKLFNLLIPELGPLFLAKGFLIKGEALEKFLKSQAEDFWSGCLSAHLDSREIDLKTLREMQWSPGKELVFVNVLSVSK
ncbi:MAG: hypothetical protein ABSE95_01830 [Thermodesulfobacteriota bacterium]